jgi:hypothetical protein
MTKYSLLLVMALILTSWGKEALSNCRGEIEGPLPNQIGTVVLFSSRESGPEHKLYGSEFWALTGPYDTGLLHSYPVRFDASLLPTIDAWNWGDAAVAGIVVSLRVDVVREGEHFWIFVKELLNTDELYDAAMTRYPNAHVGTCGSLFRRE